MKLLLPYVIIFIIWLTYELRKSDRKHKHTLEEFWERESRANSVRRKNINDLDYITIPLDSLPFFENNDIDFQNLQKTIKALANKRILNLSGKTNTDLKLEYGAANLSLLTEYDNNYSTLVNTLSRWGDWLMKNGYPTEAVTVLEFGIQCGTDVKNNYTLLAQYYADQGNTAGLEHLTAKASALQSLNKDLILKKLQSINNLSTL